MLLLLRTAQRTHLVTTATVTYCLSAYRTENTAVVFSVAAYHTRKEPNKPTLTHLPFLAKNDY